MQISKESEAALRLLCVLTDEHGKQKKENLFNMIKISKSSYEKIIDLLNSNNITQYDEKEDTIILKKNPYNISILNVISLIEGSSKISYYLDSKKTDNDEFDKQLYKLHAYVQKSIDMCYGEITIGTIIQRINNQRNKKIISFKQ